MRKPFSTQTRLDCATIGEVQLNLKCRDEIVPILAGLRHIYSQGQLRDQILGLVAGDVNEHSRNDCGREGLDYWHIIVLAAVRLGCNLDYDKLQDLAEQHRAMRHIIGIGDWQEQIDFNWRNWSCSRILTTTTVLPEDIMCTDFPQASFLNATYPLSYRH